MLQNNTIKMPYANLWEKYLAETLGVFPASELLSDIRGKYQELCFAHGKISHRRLKKHLYGNLFPQIAAYKILLGVMSDDTALSMINNLHLLTLKKLKQCNEHLFKHSFCFSFYRILVPLILKYGHPSEGWDIEFIENSRRLICARVYRCFYYNVAKDYNVSELISIYCNGDDYLFKDPFSPYIEWGRTTTMPSGGNYCDIVYHKKFPE